MGMLCRKLKHQLFKVNEAQSSEDLVNDFKGTIWQQILLHKQPIGQDKEEEDEQNNGSTINLSTKCQLNASKTLINRRNEQLTTDYC